MYRDFQVLRAFLSVMTVYNVFVRSRVQDTPEIEKRSISEWRRFSSEMLLRALYTLSVVACHTV